MSTIRQDGKLKGLSGHIQMTTEINEMFKESYNKVNSIEARRHCGMLQHRPYRNPLNAEKTPRIDYTGYDFSIPPGPPEAQRWDYPDIDWGLMAKFPSQKKIYETIYSNNAEYAQKMAKFKEFQASQAAASNGSQIVGTSRKLEGVKEFNPFQSKMVEPVQDTARLSLQKSLSSKALSSAKSKKTFEDIPISTFKSVGNEHPELLSEWRAKRAAKFIATQKDPFEGPSSPIKTHEGVFKPGGAVKYDANKLLVVPPSKQWSGATATSMQKIPPSHFEGQRAGPAAGEPDMSTTKMKSQLSALMSELESTEEQIKDQRLKIGLHPAKTVGYAQPKKSLRRLASTDAMLKSP